MICVFRFRIRRPLLLLVLGKSQYHSRSLSVARKCAMRSSPKTFPVPRAEAALLPPTTTTLIMPNCACVLLPPPTEEADLAMRRRRREGRLLRLVVLFVVCVCCPEWAWVSPPLLLRRWRVRSRPGGIGGDEGAGGGGDEEPREGVAG